METKKRERSANFNNAEVQLLVNLVERHKQIIENKKTDAVTNRDKETAWKKIESFFNSCGISTVERSWKTLKLKYEGVKKSTKKKSSVQRQEMYRTGGGPSTAPEFTTVEEKVMSICSNIKGLEARHDSDTIPSVPITISDMVLDLKKDGEEIKSLDTEEDNGAAAACTAQVITIDIPDMDDSLIFDQNKNDHQSQKDMDESLMFDQNKNDHESQKENKWDRWHPKALKSRVSNVLKPDTNKASVSSKLDKLSSARLELVELQIETAKREQKFKEDEHQLKMEYLANDERRKNEVHALILQKLNSTSLTNDIYKDF